MTTHVHTSLIGRAQECAQISEAQGLGLRRIIITGEAGVGKSALALQAIQQARVHRALVGGGKHAEGETGASPILRAMKQIVDAALEELYEPDIGFDQLRSSMGPVQPLFDQIFGSRHTQLNLSSNVESMVEQLALVLERTLIWLGSFGLPLAIMIDDWDRATPDVGQLYLRTSAFATQAPFCLILTGRTWPQFASKDARDQLALDLSGLEPPARLQLLSRILGAEDARVIHEHLPAAVTSPLDILQRARAVAEQVTAGMSIQAPATIAAALQVDSTGFIAARIARLSPDALQIMALAAIIGDMVELTVLRAASGLAPTSFEAATGQLIEAEMLFRTGDSIGFPHDTIRAAIGRSGLSANIDGCAAARRLLALRPHETSVQGAMESMLLATPPRDADSLWVEPLLTGIKRALNFLDTGRANQLADLALLMDGGLERAHQETLKLCALTGLMGGNVRHTLACAARLRALAEKRSDIAFAYAISANAARAVDNSTEALQWALQGHRLLGWHFAPNPSVVSTAISIVWTNLAGGLVRALPWARDRADLDTLALGTTTATIFFDFSPPHVVGLATRLALSPTTRRTGAGLSAAIVIANLMGLHRLASRLGGQVLKDRLDNEPNWPSTAFRAHFYGRMWTNTARSFDQLHRELFADALAEGDVNLAAWVLRNQVSLLWRYGGPLGEMERLADGACSFALRVGDQANAVTSDRAWVIARALQGLPAASSTDIDPIGPPSLETSLLLQLAYHNHCGRFDEALALLVDVPQKLDVRWLYNAGERDLRFHRALAMLMVTGKCLNSDITSLRRAARLCPGDHAGRLLILRALKAKSYGQLGPAYRLMVEAARTCADLDRLHEVSLARFLAAELARACARPDEEQVHLELGRRAWLAWGACEASHRTLRDLAGSKTDLAISDLSRRLEQSERENRAKTRLLALVGHELRTPLQAISGAADLIQHEPGQSRDMSIIAASIDRLSAMVDDLSAVTALEAGELAVHPRAFHLDALLQIVVDTHAGRLRAAGLSLSLDAAIDGQTWLFGDDKRLQQILDNLLINARKYGAGRVLLTVSNDRDQWTFAVEDQGPGLSPEQALKVFEPFVRGPSAGATPGHGIGLWLARKLAERLRGRLELAAPNQASGGARFVLTVPLARSNRLPAAGSQTGTGSRRIILIEDEPLSRDVLQRMLALDGHQVVAFDSGQAALNALPGEPPGYACALVDGNMPGLDGLETARRLRGLEGFKQLKIILITAQVTDEFIQAQHSGVADLVFQKPINLENLRGIIGQAGGLHQRDAFVEMDQTTQSYLASYLARIQACLRHRDWDELAVEAHKLGGAALMCGLDQLGGVALELERTARTRDETEADDLISQIEDLLGQSKP